jgi:hypothetical protein
MSWHKAIGAAATWQELLAVAKDFVANLSPQEVATLPPSCQQIRIKGTDDIYFWHERLAEEFFARAAKDNPSATHREVLDFFTIASERASELCGTPNANAAPSEGAQAQGAVRGTKRVLH